jgi:hypothetical protein
MRTKPVVVVAIALLWSLSAGFRATAGAQSLADVARKEQERRKTIKQPAKLLTNKDLASVQPTAPADDGAAAEAAPASAADAAKGNAANGSKPDAAADKKPAEPVKDQAYWSGRAKGLQTQLDRDQSFAEALQSRINALTTQYTNQGDPVQQSALANDRQKAVAELNGLTKQIADDKKAMADLQEEARSAGVPSGWLR